jgi:hypothetical protein
MANVLETALEQAIHALGGPKSVGHMLRNELEPADAATWLKHCLADDRREKLSLNQIEFIFDRAHKASAYEGFKFLGQRLGCNVTPTAPEVVVSELLERANAVRAELRELEETASNLTDNPRLLAMMKAANLRVEP